MRFPEIDRLLPHAAPMILLDRVVFADDDSLCAEVTIRPDSFFCEADGVGAWAGVEYMAQAIAAYAGFLAWRRDEPVKPGLLLGTRHFETTCPAYPIGASLQVCIERLFQGDKGLGAFDCRIESAGTLLAKAILNVFQPQAIDDFLKEIVL